MNTDAEKILVFWFGSNFDALTMPKEISARWFKKSDAFDIEIKTKFEDIVEKAMAGNLDSWKENNKTRLALILAADQFSRNIFRNTPKSFSLDPLSVELSRSGIKEGFDKSLTPYQRAFFYMPLMHSEDLDTQKLSTASFENLASEVGPELKASFEGFHKFAKQHEKIIVQFNRFPHRNKILGRKSTPEEETFLNQPGSSF